MINKIINNIINSSTATLFESKDKIITIAKKRAEEEIKTKIPSPSALEAQLKALQNNSNFQSNLIKAEKTYNKFISLINKAIKRLEDSQNELKSVKSKITSISTKLTTLTSFADILDPIFNILKGLLPSIDGFLAASSGPVASGLLINKLGEQKKEIKDLIKKGEDNVDSIGGIDDFFNKEKEKIEGPVDKAIANLEEAIQKLENLKAQMISIYQEFLLSSILPELNDDGRSPNSNVILGNVPLSDYIKDEDNLSTIVSDAFGAGSGNNLDDDLEESSTSIAFKDFNQ